MNTSDNILGVVMMLLMMAVAAMPLYAPPILAIILMKRWRVYGLALLVGWLGTLLLMAVFPISSSIGDGAVAESFRGAGMNIMRLWKFSAICHSLCMGVAVVAVAVGKRRDEGNEGYGHEQ